MQAIDHIYLVFRNDVPPVFDRASLSRYSGLNASEVEAVISESAVSPAVVTTAHLLACRAVTFAMDAGLDFRSASDLVGRSTLNDNEYKSCIARIADAAHWGAKAEDAEFAAAVEAIAAAARGCGMVPPRSLAA